MAQSLVAFSQLIWIETSFEFSQTGAYPVLLRADSSGALLESESPAFISVSVPSPTLYILIRFRNFYGINLLYAPYCFISRGLGILSDGVET